MKIIKNFVRLFLLLLVFSSCQKEPQIPENTPDYPGVYMYNQRAYPDNYINKKAIKKAIVQTKNALARKDNTTTNWQLKGPVNIGGRVTDIAIDPADENTVYIGTAVGGVFKTTDKGNTWNPVFDNIGRPSIGNIAIAPSDAQRIYVGTGEANGSATSGAFFGDGIYRSDDAGATWTHIGLEETQHIARIVVDPNDKDRVFAATTGTLYGKNTERGLYRSLDAGNSWEKVLYVSDSTAVIDVVMNPQNTNILFAATWERIRYPWVRNYGGITSGIHRSLDGGNTWEKLTIGLPVSDSETGRIGLAISHSNPNIIYATYTTNSITNVFDGLYKSTDNGNSWSLVAKDQISDVNATFGWYFGNLRVHPDNPDKVYVMGQLLYHTSDGGASWGLDNSMHVDFHSMAYAPSNPNTVFVGCDGGLYLSEDAGNTWSHFDNLPITQFYNIAVDAQNPVRMYGGTQDNNTLRTTTGSDDDWHSIWGGDGFQVNVDKHNGMNVYAESQWGNLARSTDGGDTMQWATDGIDSSDRRNWNTPVEISPFNTGVLYYGTYRLYKSTDKAVSWNPISDDLTGGQHPSGATSYGTLTCIAPSYNNLDVIYTGSDDGHVNVSFDGGASWHAIDDALPDRFVSQIIVSPQDDLVAYVTFSGFSVLDYTPHVYKTIDGGQNWTDISGNLPDVPVNDIVLNPENDNLYVATDTGVWFSTNQGNSWDVLGVGLPLGIVADIRLHEASNTLYAGTFGRSLFSYNLNDDAASIFETPDDAKFVVYPNPVNDFLYLHFPQKISGLVQVRIYDISGKKQQKIYRNTHLQRRRDLKLKVPDLTPGMYVLEVQTSGQNFKRRIIKN